LLFYDPVALLVAVEVSGQALRVNISLDNGLLARIDDASKRSGLSRSALLARGARTVIATEVGGVVGLRAFTLLCVRARPRNTLR
jgi:hypothetical protein